MVYLVPLVGLFFGTIILGGNQAGRAVGTLGEPNALSAASVFILPFIWFTTKQPIKAAATLVSLIIIFLSGSRSGLLALIIQFTFLFLTRKSSTLKSLIISLLILASSMILPIIEGGGGFENRREVWLTALFAAWQSPILGNGFGNVEQALDQASIKLNNNVQYQYVDSTHNFLLDFLVQGGLVALIMILVLIFTTLRHLVRKDDKLLLTTLLGVLTVMSFNPTSVVTLIAFWWLLGQGLASKGETLRA